MLFDSKKEKMMKNFGPTVGVINRSVFPLFVDHSVPFRSVPFRSVPALAPGARAHS